MWLKQGLIFHCQGAAPWSRSHTQLPIVDKVSGDVWRIYYATRNQDGLSNVSYIETVAGDPSTILYVHSRPLFDLGPLGSFDEHGIMPQSVVTLENGDKYLYYVGWSQKKSVPYHNSIGLAFSKDGGRSFTKLFPGPIISAWRDEPYFVGTACVLRERNRWRMWYQSCTEWRMVKNYPEPFYHIKYAESDDGIHWRREGIVAIDYADDEEIGICSASVLKSADEYAMWYCYRKEKDYRSDPSDCYRIGYAHSRDGVVWERRDSESGIERSRSASWDSEMVAYPCVVSHGGTRYLFYNGNGFGRSGFGYALWHEDD